MTHKIDAIDMAMLTGAVAFAMFLLAGSAALLWDVGVRGELWYFPTMAMIIGTLAVVAWYAFVDGL